MRNLKNRNAKNSISQYKSAAKPLNVAKNMMVAITPRDDFAVRERLVS
jgi:hypothetical protein